VDANVTQILNRLKVKGARAVELIVNHKTPEQQVLWDGDARLYQAFARRLIDQGHPTRGLNLAREGLSAHPAASALQYLLALATARGGNPRAARAHLDTLDRTPGLDPHLLTESLCLRARLLKDDYERARDPGRKERRAAESAEMYLRAAALPDADSFPFINAATMTVLAGDLDAGRSRARRALELAERESQTPQKAGSYWVMATLGEAHYILGNHSAAADWYLKAVAKATADGDVGNIASMRRNALLLRAKLSDSAELEHVFHTHLGTVVAFSGHTIDHPLRVSRDGLAPRFPDDPQLVRETGDDIRAALADLNATVGYCSGACGADLLFARAMLERKAELHIVLPFARDDFYTTSVDFGAPGMSAWRKRFDAVLADVPADNVHFATTEPHLGDDILFDFVNQFIQGLAVIRAAQRGGVPHALVVHDGVAHNPEAEPRPGGAGDFLMTWAGDPKPKIIDLGRLRRSILGEDRPPADRPADPPARPPRGSARHIKAMLFADVKDFSKLEEVNSPRFFLRFLDAVHGVLTALPHPPILSNTWGDGLYLVFDEPTHAAEAALQLLERAEGIDWAGFGLGQTSPIRIGGHAGPVFSGTDPILGKTNYFGSHVTRAARIEPAAMPGCAFVSEQFAALLALDPGREYACEYVGIEKLNKGYDVCPLYRLARR
jgi:class 3 adenylate cyclase